MADNSVSQALVPAHGQGFVSCAWCKADGSWCIVTAGADGKLTTRKTEDLCVIQSTQNTDGAVYYLTASPNGSLVATVDDQYVKVSSHTPTHKTVYCRPLPSAPAHRARSCALQRNTCCTQSCSSSMWVRLHVLCVLACVYQASSCKTSSRNACRQQSCPMCFCHFAEQRMCLCCHCCRYAQTLVRLQMSTYDQAVHAVISLPGRCISTHKCLTMPLCQTLLPVCVGIEHSPAVPSCHCQPLHIASSHCQLDTKRPWHTRCCWG